MTSDAGALLLREADRAIGLIAACFRDGRDPERVVHVLRTLIGQRIIGLALGYEDVADHDDLRFDPVLALFSDRLEPRRPDRAQLGGKSTLNRLEHAPRDSADRYRKIAVDADAVESLLVDLFLDALLASGAIHPGCWKGFRSKAAGPLARSLLDAIELLRQLNRRSNSRLPPAGAHGFLAHQVAEAAARSRET